MTQAATHGGASRSRRLSWKAILALTVFAACIAVICALAAHHACTEPGPPVSRPEPGTARAGYCATVDAGALRAALIFLAVVAVPAAAAASRRRPAWTVIVTALVALALLASAIVASSLNFAYTI